MLIYGPHTTSREHSLLPIDNGHHIFSQRRYHQTLYSRPITKYSAPTPPVFTCYYRGRPSLPIPEGWLRRPTRPLIYRIKSFNTLPSKIPTTPKSASLKVVLAKPKSPKTGIKSTGRKVIKIPCASAPQKAPLFPGGVTKNTSQRAQKSEGLNTG